MSELKPCPFCGSNAEAYDTTKGCTVACSNGDCVELQMSDWTMNKAASLWNTRTPQIDWISVDTDDLPPLDHPVRVWDDDGYSPDYSKEHIARRVKTNEGGDWHWYALDFTNTMLNNVTHFANQSTPPKQ